MTLRQALLATVAVVGLGGVPANGGAEGLEHVVAEGESLWSIAARSDIYDDPYLWPVIYKFNRDQIQDPKQIYPKQVLQIPTDIDAKTRGLAHKEAGAPN